MRKIQSSALTGALAGIAMSVSGVASAQCEVVTDASLDMLPQLDIISASLFSNGNSIGATIEVFDLNLPTVDADYAVHWVDSTGNGYFIGVGVFPVDGGQGLGQEFTTTADIGFYDPGTGAYTWNADAEGVATVDGNTLTVLVDGIHVGLPSGELTGIGAVTTEYFSGLYPLNYDSTANDGSWRVGDNCGKSELSAGQQAAVDLRDAQALAASAGAFGSGLLVLSVVLLGLRRRS